MPGPALYNTRLDNHEVRAATVQRASLKDPSDTLTITVAETFRDRHQQAREDSGAGHRDADASHPQRAFAGLVRRQPRFARAQSLDRATGPALA